ncbi:hypothetical protein B0H13DRAFT_1651885, partial [Mycena leptocephala]
SVISLSWISAITAGHTKRITTNAIMLTAYICLLYCLGNAPGPFTWQAKYKPRNHVPRIVSCICYVGCIALVLVIRSLLVTENEHRDTEPPQDDRYNEVSSKSKQGRIVHCSIRRNFLDLTDWQDHDFRYVY